MENFTKPLIFKEGSYSKQDIEGFHKNQKINKIIDIYQEQIRELFEINNPGLIGSDQFDFKLKEFSDSKIGSEQILAGNWVFFPWNGNFVHMVVEEDYFSLRTNRNKNLITKEEQLALSEFTVGFVGLSVGSDMAINMTYSGISNSMKLAEFDTLETTNLNRLRARVDQIGGKKIDITMEKIYQVNPYANLIDFSQGINKENLDLFIKGKKNLDLIFEIIDDFEMKVLLRIAAKQAKIPIIMLTNLGDNVLIDIERYDLDQELKPFNGRADHVVDLVKSGSLTKEEVHKYAIEIVGKENVPEKAQDSVKEIGNTLVGRPQLMSTVSISGGLASFLSRKIALGNSLPSGRYKFSIENIIQN